MARFGSLIGVGLAATMMIPLSRSTDLTLLLKPEQAAAVLGWAGEEPRSKRRLCERVEREFRIRVSPGTICRQAEGRIAARRRSPPHRPYGQGEAGERQDRDL